jgi:pSer/pThr/pTyr-binding forkhead associated (FHA) protein
MLILQDSHVSSFHAEILVKPDGYVVKDLESTNGVFVNNRKISEKTLLPGDMIKIGATTITPS